jgi:SAM-dependent methyltransferase
MTTPSRPVAGEAGTRQLWSGSLSTLASARATVFLDAGAGVGGPAAFLVDRFTAAPVLAEPMLDACVAARRLFGLPTVAACGAALPFAAATFPAAWLLGVLCTTPDKGAILRELRRVLIPDGRLGLVVYVRATSDLPQPPSENDFPRGRSS